MGRSHLGPVKVHPLIIEPTSLCHDGWAFVTSMMADFIEQVPHQRMGDRRIVEINPAATGLSSLCDRTVREGAGDALERLFDE